MLQAALKYYSAILLPTGPMGFALLDANIPLAERSTNIVL